MKQTIQQAFDAAVQHQQAGQFKQAEPLWRQILAQQPQHAESASLFGILLAQTDRCAEALQWMNRAISLAPSESAYQNNLGMIYATMGRPDDAIAAYRRAIQINPNHADARVNLASTLKQTGRLDDAIAEYRRALQTAPNHPHALCNLGDALTDKGDFNQAITAISRAVAIVPNFPEAFHNLANALLAVNRLDESIAAAHQALTLRPEFPGVYNTLGNALVKKDLIEQAIIAYQRAICQQASFPDAYNNLGNALKKKERREQAETAFRQALHLRPDWPEVHSNLANNLKEMGRLDEAIDEYRLALSLRPDFHEALVPLAAAMAEKGRHQDAIALYRKAIALRPDVGVTHWNLALLLLTLGDFKQGWREFEWRFKADEVPLKPRNFRQPFWKGEKLSGRKILIYTEQGFGDAIQFARYLPLVAARGGKILLQCQPQLSRLMKTVAGVQTVLPAEDLSIDFDVHIPLLSLASILDVEIPKEIPYVSADRSRVNEFKEMLPRDNRLRIGVAWAGRAVHPNDKNRSINLADLAPLAEIPNLLFVSLQKGEAAEEAQHPPAGMNVADFSDHLIDFADSAAMMENLDLIVTVDSAAAHLAGALGKPVWVLVPFVPDWRWMLDRSDSPWYPTIRLFRQPKPGDWQTPIQNLSDALGDFRRT